MKNICKTALILATAALAFGCTSPLVEKAAGSFHDGYDSSIKVLENRQAALVSVNRTRLTMLYFKAAENAISRSSVAPFAAYVCDQPVETRNLQRGFATLGAGAEVVNPKELAPDDNLPARVSGTFDAMHDLDPLKDAEEPLAADQAFCREVVTQFLLLRYEDLPLTETKSKVGAFIPAAMAIVDAAKAAWDATNTVFGILEEEARARRLLRFIKNSDTQDKVEAAFGQIYTVSEVTTAFCNDKNFRKLCAKSVMIDDKPKAHDKDKEAPNPPPGASTEPKPETCFERVDHGVFTPAGEVTVLNAMTIAERWSTLRLAWYRYYDLDSAKDVAVDKQFLRREALDRAIGDYLAIPPANGVADAMVKAWTKLTYLANGCLTGAEALGALDAFAENASNILAAVKKASDAKDDAAKALGPGEAK